MTYSETAYGEKLGLLEKREGRCFALLEFSRRLGWIPLYDPLAGTSI